MPTLGDLSPIYALLPAHIQGPFVMYCEKLFLMHQSMSLSIRGLNGATSLGTDQLKLAYDFLVEMDTYASTLTRIWSGCETMFVHQYCAFLQRVTNAVEKCEEVQNQVPFRFCFPKLPEEQQNPKQVIGRLIDTMRRETFEMSRAVDRLKGATVEAANAWTESHTADALEAFADRWKRYTWLWQRWIQQVHLLIQHVRVFARLP